MRESERLVEEEGIIKSAGRTPASIAVFPKVLSRGQ